MFQSFYRYCYLLFPLYINFFPLVPPIFVQKIPQPTQTHLTTLKAVMDPKDNFTHYRSVLEKLPQDTPCVPYIGTLNILLHRQW